jgi:putative glutamate/gamma-aminobutyrate antiporter
VKSKPTIGVLTLAMLNLAIVCTLRGLPIMAEEGLSLVFYFIVVALVFFIPVSLITAELATAWPPRGPGGVYVWVTEAFGPRVGFLAIWLQWVQNVVWFPTILSFIAASLAYMFDPSLAENRFYMMAIVLVAFWGGTWVNFRGMKASGMLSLICVSVGTILPGVLIVVLGIVWLTSGEGSSIVFSFDNLVPDMSNIRNIVFLAGAVLIFSGMEVSGAHSEDVVDPKRTYPRAILLSSVVALFLLMLGALSIAVVVPQKDISLVAGVMEAFVRFFDAHGIGWLIPGLAVLIAAGSVGELSAWIVGPAKGLMVTAKHGHLPPFLQRTNSRNVPTNILFVQGAVTTVITLVFLFMPTVSSSYWILSALSIILYLLMYVILFASAIRLRYSQPDVERTYKVPGGNAAMWIVAGLGIAGALFTIVVGFFPPSQIATGNIAFYELFLIVGTAVTCAVPFILFMLQKPSWRVGVPPDELSK